jgi:hypothetical protein
VYDTIPDFDAFVFGLGTIDTLQVSAAAFGGSLVPGQRGSGAAPTSFFFSTAAGSVEGQNADVVGAPIGTSTFYYDESPGAGGGGLYYDQDGAGTARVFTKIAQIPFAVFPHSFTSFNLAIVA